MRLLPSLFRLIPIVLGLATWPAVARAMEVVHVCQAALFDGYSRPVAGAKVEFWLENYEHPHQELLRTESFTGADGRGVAALSWEGEESILLRCKVSRPVGVGRRIRFNSGQRSYHGGGVVGGEVEITAELAPPWDDRTTQPGLKTAPDGQHGSGEAHLYLGADGKYDRVVVLPQGMDFFEPNPEEREDRDRMWFTYSRILKPLHSIGYDVWLVRPYLTGSNIHEQAAEFAQAIQQASEHDGGPIEGKVIVAGYSLGGLVARLATARWEDDADWRASLGLPDEMPVNLVAFGDAALRGANISRSIQKELWDHDVATKINLASCAATQLLRDNYTDEGQAHRAFFETGETTSFPAAGGTCDLPFGLNCLCEAGPAVEGIGGDGFPHGPPVYAFSAGTWDPDRNLCYGGEQDWNDREQDLCPSDPGGDGAFVPQPGDNWLSIRAYQGGVLLGSQQFAGSGEDLAAGSRFAIAFEREPRIRELLPVPWYADQLDIIHNWSFTFIPIVSALAGDSPDALPFDADHQKTGTYQAAHNRPEEGLWTWLFQKFALAYGGGGPGPGGYPPGAPGNVMADPVIGGWDQVKITWEDRSDNEDRFEIQRKRGANGNWEHVEDVPADRTESTDAVPEVDSGPGATTFYFYRVIARNGYGQGISNRAEARFYSEPPGVADTLRPRGCVSELMPTLSWHGGGHTSKFYVRLLDAATGEEAMDDAQVRENEVRVGRPLEARKPYMLRVWGMNNAGWGTGSAPEFFRTFCELVDPPEWLEPVGCIDTLTPVARWTEVSGALSYHLRIYEMATQGNQQDTLVVDEGASTTSFTIPPGKLHAGKDYRGWVKPHTAGNSDPYSRIRFFTPMCSQGVGAGFVSTISPADGLVSTNQPEFVFEPADRADAYRLEVWNETGTAFVYAREYTAASICAGGSCSARPDHALAAGRYAWWVRAGRNGNFDPTAVWAWVRIPNLPALSISGAAAQESAGSLGFHLTLSQPSVLPVTVELSTQAGTAEPDRDYLPISGQWTIPAGSTTLSAAVPVVDDAVHEATEALSLRLANVTGALLAADVGSGMISDDDPAPTLSIGDATVTEGAAGQTTLELEVRLTGATDLPVSTWFESRGCSATEGNDYLAPSPERLDFLPGEATKTLKFSVFGDGRFEGDELFIATLSQAAGATVGDGWGQGRIKNDDPRGRGDRSMRPDADFDGNGRGDLLFRHDESHRLSVWLMDGGERIGGSLVQAAGTPGVDWQVVGNGDLDRSGTTDLLWQNQTSGTIVYWYMAGSNQTGGASLPGEEDPAWRIVGAGDFDLDGWVDLLWQHDGTGELQIWRMQNQALLERLPLEGTSRLDPKTKVAAIADFDGDGDLDLLRRGEAGELGLWLLRGTGFSEEQDFEPAVLADANWRIAGAWDVDDDGWNDLILQNEVSGRMVVWYLVANQRICGAFLSPDAPIDPRWRLTGLR